MWRLMEVKRSSIEIEIDGWGGVAEDLGFSFDLGGIFGDFESAEKR